MAITINNIQVGETQNGKTVTVAAYTPTADAVTLVITLHAVDNASSRDITFKTPTYAGNNFDGGVASGEHTGGPPDVSTAIYWLDDPLSLAPTGDVVGSINDAVNNTNVVASKVFTLLGNATGGPEATNSDNTDVASPYDLGITTLTDDAMIVEAIGYHQNTGFAANSGQTEENDVGGTNFRFALYSEIIANAGAQTQSVTSAQSEQTCHVLAAWAPFVSQSTTRVVSRPGGIIPVRQMISY